MAPGLLPVDDVWEGGGGVERGGGGAVEGRHHPRVPVHQRPPPAAPVPRLLGLDREPLVDNSLVLLVNLETSYIKIMMYLKFNNIKNNRESYKFFFLRVARVIVIK